RDFHVTGVQTCALPILPGEVGQWVALATLVRTALGDVAGGEPVEGEVRIGEQGLSGLLLCQRLGAVATGGQTEQRGGGQRDSHRAAHGTSPSEVGVATPVDVPPCRSTLWVRSEVPHQAVGQ